MSKTNAKILLAFVFAARGISFLFSKNLMTGMQPMNILAVRFILAFLILSVIFMKKLRECSKASLKGGLTLGVLYTVCMIFEMYGLRLIDSGVSSLIENMAIVLVPLYTALLTRTRPDGKTMLCALAALVGVGFLSLTQISNPGAAAGIILTLCAALTFGMCIITTAKVSRDGDPITIGVLQMGTMGILSLIVSLIGGSFSLPQTGSQWLMILLLALVCSCFGFVFQPVGQKYLSADTAAVFTVINPLTASVFGIIVGGESMSIMKLIGYILILGALVFYNVKGAKQ